MEPKATIEATLAEKVEVGRRAAHGQVMAGKVTGMAAAMQAKEKHYSDTVRQVAKEVLR